ncbi:MAG: sensor histidine kinase, partial [Campylobacteraceae bacterium]|nr:sensor histidine kinase [Campylobacteraceae bacterium]
MKIIFLFVIFLNNSHANTSILILNSYHKGYALSDNILKGIEEVLYKDANIDVNILYMDAKRINSKEYFESLKKLYTVQLKNQEYDLIITIDDFA